MEAWSYHQARRQTVMLPQVTFRGLSPSASVVETVWRKARKLAELEPALSGCHVVIEAETRGAQRPMSYRVTVQLLGGKRHEYRHARHAQDANAHVALRDAFRAARRQLEGRSKHGRALPAYDRRIDAQFNL
jgi:hypothetical protein